MRKVAVIGVGRTVFRPVSPELSYRELMFDAATRAYRDAGVDVRRDVDSFLCVSEDFLEGTSIFDEYVPDQIGGALKPLCTVSGDGLQAVAMAVMQIQTGLLDVVAVEGHSKASELLDHDKVIQFALDPVHNRPLGFHQHCYVGMEMTKFLHDSKITREQCAAVVEKNRRNALGNPWAAYGAHIDRASVLEAEVLASPLTSMDVGQNADGAVVAVLAAEDRVNEFTDSPIWLQGVGWCSETPSMETRVWGKAPSVEKAGRMACKMAKISDPAIVVDFAEVDDTYSFKELQNLEALRLFGQGESGIAIEEGRTAVDGELPVNPSGGSLGEGYVFEAQGLQKLFEAVLQLRGQAGGRQLPEVDAALVQSSRCFPSTSSAVALLSS